MIRFIQFVFRCLEFISPTLGSHVATRLFFKPLPHKKLWDEDLSQHQKVSVSVSSAHVVVRTFGEGIPVILLHGWSSSGVSFQTLIKKLTSKGFMCVVPDLPGHGESGGDTSNVFMFQSTAEKMMDQYPDAAGIIGHSLGGVAAVMAMINKPSSINKVVTIASPVYFDQMLDEFMSKIGGGRRIKAEMMNRLYERFGDRENEVSIGNRLDELPKNLEHLVIHDKEDTEVPYQHSVDLSKRSNSRHFGTSGLGHNRILRDDAVHARILNFIETKKAP